MELKDLCVRSSEKQPLHNPMHWVGGSKSSRIFSWLHLLPSPVWISDHCPDLGSKIWFEDGYHRSQARSVLAQWRITRNQASIKNKMEGNSLSSLLGFASAHLLSVSLWLISDQHILRLPSVVWGISFPIPREESRTDINFPGKVNSDVLSWGVLRWKSNDVNDYPGFSRDCYISQVNRRGGDYGIFRQSRYCSLSESGKTARTIDFCRLSPQKTVVAQVCRGKTSLASGLLCWSSSCRSYSMLLVVFCGKRRFIQQRSFKIGEFGFPMLKIVSKTDFRRKNIDLSAMITQDLKIWFRMLKKTEQNRISGEKNIDVSLRILALRGEESPGISRWVDR